MSSQTLKNAMERRGFTQTDLAEALKSRHPKVSQSHVWKWLNSPNPDEMPPAEYCPDIARILNIPISDLRTKFAESLKDAGYVRIPTPTPTDQEAAA